MDKSYYQKYEPVFGVWKNTKLLGEGSFGKVFELEREDFGVVYKAALKVITIPQNDSEILDARAEGMDEQSICSHFSAFARDLVQEFELMSRFKGNSNVVSYENHQVLPHADGVGWDILIQMELLTPLNRYTTEHTVTRQDVIRLGIDLCKALELCQKYNVIHRDVKPENIFVSENGDFKLGDFGIARTVEKTTSDLSKKGTYTYMAPEVYKGEAYGSSVDIYSLGIVMYRLLNANRTPFLPSPPAYISPEDRENALLRRIGGAPLPKPIHAEGRLAEIVLKACAYEAKERYSSPAQMRQELEAILYTQEEQKYIYPEGDDVPQDSYVKTEDAPPSEADNKTVSAFGNTLGDKTVSVFGHASGDEPASVLDAEKASTLSAFDSVLGDKTVSAFENVSLPVQPPKKKRKVWLLLATVLLVCIAAGAVFHQRLSELYSIYLTDDITVPWNGTQYLDEVKDLSGRVVRQPVYNSDGSVTVRSLKYGDDGVRMEYTLALSGRCIEHKRYVYQDGKAVESYTIDDANGGARTETQEYAYSADGYTILEYDGQGALTGSFVFTQDAQGNTLSMEILDENGERSVLYRYDENTSWIYNADDQLIEIHTSEDWGDGGRIYSTYSAEDISLENRQYASCYNARKQLASTYQGSGLDETRYIYNASGQRASKTHERTVTEYTYDELGYLIGEKIYENEVLNQEKRYDKGKVTQSLSYSDDGTWVDYERTFDTQGNQVTAVSYSAANVEEARFEYSYNELNQCIRCDQFDQGALFSCSTYAYDEQGRKVSEKEVYANGDSMREETTEYHEDGSRTIHHYDYNRDGSLCFELRFEYDAQGQEQRMDHYNADGDLTQFRITYYTSEGQKHLEQFGLPYDGGENSIVKISYVAVQLVDRSYPEGGQNTSRYEIESYQITDYDANGNYIEWRKFDADGVQIYP